jgi:hypothetical protein
MMTQYGGGSLQHIIWGCITRDGVVSTLDTSEIRRLGGIKLLAVEECHEVKLSGSRGGLMSFRLEGKCRKSLGISVA